MINYIVCDKFHQRCEITAESVDVDKDNGDLIFMVGLDIVVRFAAGWLAYSGKENLVSYQVVGRNG